MLILTKIFIFFNIFLNKKIFSSIITIIFSNKKIAFSGLYFFKDGLKIV